MKKVIISLFLLLLVGCGMNTSPSKEIEKFLGKYVSLDSSVILQLNEVVDSSGVMTEKQKETYSNLMKKQYKNMKYKIKNQSIDDSLATVEVEVEVYDYEKAIGQAESYLITNKDEFIDDSGKVDDELFLDYKLKKIDEEEDKITYTINFTLTKKEGNWVVDDLTDIDLQKLHGLYS